jgi:hypothetical protein
LDDDEIADAEIIIAECLGVNLADCPE